MTRRLFRFAVLLLCCFGLSTADAAPKKAKSGERAVTQRALLLWGPSDSTDYGERARTVLAARLPLEVPLPSRTMPVGDWVGSARFRLGGTAEAIPCVTPSSEIELPADVRSEVVALTRTAYAKLNDLDYENALRLYQMAQGRLSCQEEFVPRAANWEAYFYGGIAAFYVGDQQSARGYFRQAATIAPEREWDASYPPDPQATFLSAVQDVISRPRGKVYGDLRGTNYREVWLDGQQLDLTKPFESSVLVGKHLVQAVDDQGKWSSFAREVKEGATLTFFSNLGAEQMVLAGPDSLLQAVSAPMLVQRAREENLGEYYVVTLHPDPKVEPLVQRFYVETSAWTRVDPLKAGDIAAQPKLTPEERRRRAFLREADWRSSGAVGFKLTQMILCGKDEVDADGHCLGSVGEPSAGEQRTNTYAGGLVSIDIRMVKGLTLDIRLGMAATDFREGGTILPEVTGGVQYRFLTGVLEPWIGFGADLFGLTYKATESTPARFQLMAGILPYGGVDIEAPDGFRVTVEGGVPVILAVGQQQVRWPAPYFMLSIGRFLP